MKTYGIIPSRFGSSRFPGKPLAVLAGKPLVAWVVEAVKKAKSLDEVLVATDDERIVAAVEQYGGMACGWKLTGCGGGGYLILISETPIPNAIRVIPCRSDRE